MAGLIDYGQGYRSRALGGLSQAAAAETGRNRTADQIAAANKAGTANMIGSGAGLAAQYGVTQYLGQKAGEEVAKEGAKQAIGGIVNNPGTQQMGMEAGKQLGLEAGKQLGVEAGKQLGTEAGKQLGVEAGKQLGVEAGKQVATQAATQAATEAGSGALAATLGAVSSALPIIGPLVGLALSFALNEA